MTGATIPEVSRPFPITRIGEGVRFVVEARPEECLALAERMGVPAIHGVTCRFDLRRLPGDEVAADGLLQARLRQTCVVSLEDFDADVTEAFAIRFVPEGRQTEQVDPESDDEVMYDGGVIDLGEAASEQLALALDPFPRMTGAELPASAQLAEGGAFAVLGKLLPQDDD